MPLAPLARCVGDVGVFAREVWGRRPLLLRATDNPGPPGSDLLSAADVDELLAGRALRAPFVRLVQGGTTIPAERWTRSITAGNRVLRDLPDSAKVAALFTGGATVVLQAVHRVHPPLADFCRDLAREVGHQTQTNVYVTPPGAQGFAAHHDTHDVLVLQVDGIKSWTVRAPLVELPLPAQPSATLDPAAADAAPVVLQADLHPGDVLYLPRGWLHEAATTEQRSIHLTVGLLQTTWYDVLTDLVELAAGELELREALPLPGLGADDVEGFRAAAMSWLAGVPAEQLAGLVAARRRRAVPAEPVPPLAQEAAARVLTASTPVRPRAGVPWDVVEEGDRTVVRVRSASGTVSVSVPGYVGPAVRRVLASPSTPAGLGLDAADGVVLVRRLLREGLLLPA